MPSQTQDDAPVYNPGDMIDGRYKVVRKLGSDAMGTVFEVDLETNGGAFALTLVASAQGETEEQKQTTLGEIRDEARISNGLHEQLSMRGVHLVLPVTDFGITRDAHALPFLVTPVLRGTSLRTLLDRRRETEQQFPLRFVVNLLDELTLGLEQIHARGVVHGNITPAKLLLADGADPALRLLDFGLAVETNHPRPRPHFQGSPRYAAPELFEGGVPTPSSDDYSVAMIFYELLTLQGPWDAPSRPVGLDEYRTAHATRPVPPPNLLREGVPPTLNNLILRMLSKDPAAR